MIDPYIKEVDRLTAENKKLKAAIITAYGILWRDHSGPGSSFEPRPMKHDARKSLLDVITKKEQKQGINAALQKYGPVRREEIERLGL